MKTLLAVDPGANGGIAVKHSTHRAFAYRMPDTEGDLIELLAEQRIVAQHENHECVAVVEDQTGCAGTRVSAPAMFKFGRSFGVLLGALQATHWRVELVRPQQWQKGFSLGTARQCGSKTVWKNKLKALAQRLYPELKVTLATADALLLLDYALRQKSD